MIRLDAVDRCEGGEERGGARRKSIIFQRFGWTGKNSKGNEELKEPQSLNL